MSISTRELYVGAKMGYTRNHKRLRIPYLKPFGGLFGLKETTEFFKAVGEI